MNEQSGDSSQHLDTLKKIKNFLEYTADISVVGFFNSEEDELYRTYQDTGMYEQAVWYAASSFCEMWKVNYSLQEIW